MCEWVFNELEKITDSIYIWNIFLPHNVNPFGIFYGTNAVNHFELVNWWLGLSFYPFFFVSGSTLTKVKLLSGFFSLEYISWLKLISIDSECRTPFSNGSGIRLICIKWQIFHPIFQESIAKCRSNFEFEILDTNTIFFSASNGRQD